MKKAQFTYTKEDGSTSKREILNPKFLKESYNYFSDFDKESVKYVQGYELDKTGLTEEQIKKYEEILSDYFELAIPTINEFFSENGLDPKKIQQKTFKKENITNPSIY